MTDVWRSQPRKFCEFCRCWLADNKPSVDFHEKGRRHQNNVAKKLNQIAKKGRKDYEAEQNNASMMKRMEYAALLSMKKDLQKHPERAELYKDSVSLLDDFEKKREVKDLSEKKKETKWFAAKDPIGRVYYWHTKSGVSQWARPIEGYFTFDEQKMLMHPPKRSVSAPPPDPDQPVEILYGESTTNMWQDCSDRNTEVVDYDLELPEQRKVEIRIPTLHQEDRYKFEEKTLTGPLSNKNKPVEFKKRKINPDAKKNVRRRIDD